MDPQKLILDTTDAFNRHDADAFANGYSSNASSYDPQYESPLEGKNAIRQDIADFFRAFPDVHAKITSPILVNGNTAAFEIEVSGTQHGPLQSPGGEIPPTAKTMSFKAGRFIVVGTDGKIQSDNRYYDMMTVMAQLGLMTENA